MIVPNLSLSSGFVMLVWCVFLCVAQQSPCPTIFQYNYDQRLNLYGVLNINSPNVANNPSATEIKLLVELSIGVKVEGFHGSVELAYSREQAADNAIKGRPLQYNVQFPPWGNIPPKVTKISVNGRTICAGQPVSGASIITTVTLRHSLMISIPSSGSNYQIPDSFDTDLFPSNNVQNSNDRYEPTFINPAIFENNRPLSNNQNTPFASNVPIEFNPQRPSNGGGGTSAHPSELFNRPVGSQNPPVINRPESTTTTRRPTLPEFPTWRPQTEDVDQRTCGTPSKALNPLVVHGSKVSKREFPWLAALFDNDSGQLKYQCAGSLISSKHVVTAAHCCKIRQRIVKPENMKVVLGKLNINEAVSETGWKRVDVVRIIIHELYESVKPDFDVAVLKLAEDIRTTNDIMPICLWTESNSLNRIVGQTGVVAGWGRNENDERTTQLPAQITMPIVSNTECVKSYADFSNLIANTTFCAGNQNESGPCNGDSGSGFVMKRNNKWALRGVVSLALNNNGVCDLAHYVIFTDVAKLLPWIEETMSK